MILYGTARLPGYRGGTDTAFRAAIYKHVKNWMRDKDISRMLFDTLQKLLPPDPLPAGTLLERAGAEKIAEIENAMMTEVLAIPITYLARLYLPRFNPLGIGDFKIASGIKLLELSGEYAAKYLRALCPDGEKQHSLGPTRDDQGNPVLRPLKCAFLEVEAKGFYSPLNPTCNKLMAGIKRVLALAEAAQILHPNFLGARTDAGFTTSMTPEEGLAEDCTMIVFDNRSGGSVDFRALPVGFSYHANYWEFYYNRWFPPKGVGVQRDTSVTPKQFRQKLEGLCKPLQVCFADEDKYSDILTGAEWLFDSNGISAQSETYAFLYVAIGLEAVMLSPEKEITRVLGDRLAYMVGLSRDERKQRGIANPEQTGEKLLRVVEPIRNHGSLRPRYETVFNQALVLLVSHFGSTLNSLFGAAVKQTIPNGSPGSPILKEKVTFSVEELSDPAFEPKDSIANALAFASDVSWQDMQSVHRTFKKHFRDRDRARRRRQRHHCRSGLQKRHRSRRCNCR